MYIDWFSGGDGGGAFRVEAVEQRFQISVEMVEFRLRVTGIIGLVLQLAQLRQEIRVGDFCCTGVSNDCFVIAVHSRFDNLVTLYFIHA